MEIVSIQPREITKGVNISYSQTPTNFKTSFKANLSKNNLTQASINTLSKDESGDKQKEKVDYSKIGVETAAFI